MKVMIRQEPNSVYVSTFAFLFIVVCKNMTGIYLAIVHVFIS